MLPRGSAVRPEDSRSACTARRPLVCLCCLLHYLGLFLGLGDLLGRIVPVGWSVDGGNWGASVCDRTSVNDGMHVTVYWSMECQVCVVC